MSPQYLLCPGLVRSQVDGGMHQVNAAQLARLYGVRIDQCVVLPEPGRERFHCERLRLLRRCEVGGDMVLLTLRTDGDYTLPIMAKGATS